MPKDLYYAQDFNEGDAFDLGTYTVTKDEIVEFADYEIDDEDLRVACKYVIRDLELDQRFYHKSS